MYTTDAQEIARLTRLVEVQDRLIAALDDKIEILTNMINDREAFAAELAEVSDAV